MTAPDPADYRPCVGLAILDSRDRVFAGRRADTRAEAWQMPQGGIDPDEEPWPAALRELAEETGITADKVTLLHTVSDWLYYDLPPDLQNVFWGGQYLGQRQQWYIMRFTGSDSDIDINAHLPAEFLEWQWLEREELPKRIVPFKQAIYRQVLAVINAVLTAADTPPRPAESECLPQRGNRNNC